MIPPYVLWSTPPWLWSTQPARRASTLRRTASGRMVPAFSIDRSGGRPARNSAQKRQKLARRANRGTR